MSSYLAQPDTVASAPSKRAPAPKWRPRQSTYSGRWMAWNFASGKAYTGKRRQDDRPIVFFSTEAAAQAVCDDLMKGYSHGVSR